MRARHAPALAAALCSLLASFALGCGLAGRGSVDEAPYGGQLISEEAIRLSGATTAWQALRSLAPHLDLQENVLGQPTRVSRRGRESVYLREAPLLIVDGAVLADLRELQQIAARDISSIRILTGTEGTTFYGMYAASGVIMIETKLRDHP